jgi:hypothetical protein
MLTLGTFGVSFIKRTDGQPREMVAELIEFKPHGLALVTDLEIGKYRSIPLDAVTAISPAASVQQ